MSTPSMPRLDTIPTSTVSRWARKAALSGVALALAFSLLYLYFRG